MAKINRPAKMFQPGVKSLGVSPVDEDTEGHAKSLGASNARSMGASNARSMGASSARGIKPSSARSIGAKGGDDEDTEGHRLTKD